MLHFGMMCPEVSGHLNPMITLGRELQTRGHRITFIGKLDGAEKVTAAGLDFRPIAEKEFPLGQWPGLMETLGKLSGWRALRFTLNNYRKLAGSIVRDAPAVIRALNVDGLLIDQTYSAGGAVAEYVDRPFVSVANALLLNSEPSVPPLISAWKYSSSRWLKWRNQMAHMAFQLGTGRMRRVVQRHQRKWDMPIHRTNEETFSQIAQIGQLPREFDFPRRALPDIFHYVGPMHDSKCRPRIPFDYDQLDGRPLIYASMGTLQNRLSHVFQTIAAACADLDAQLVISLGHKDAKIPSGLPGSPLVVKFAPQLELIQRASLVITHAGMNTAMESLAQGVPMVAIPVTNDQPGVASRIRWTGAGELIPLRKLSVSRLQRAIEDVMTHSFFRKNAKRLQEAIGRCGGVQLAADICEQAVRTGQPVYSSRPSKNDSDAESKAA
ncbi:MAG: glycosyltransferase [Planctomycetaceae bacterium]